MVSQNLQNGQNHFSGRESRQPASFQRQAVASRCQSKKETKVLKVLLVL